MILFLILVVIAVSTVTRLVTFPLRMGGRYYNPYRYGYGYDGYYGYRRHRGIGHLLLVLFVLYALSHLFGHHHRHPFL
jgi:uncharacterized membrane protein